MLTLSSIQGGSFQTASGYCTTSQDYKDLVNLLIPRLLNRGDWAGTLLPIRACVSRGCVTWPRYVNQIRKVNTCRQSVTMRNVFYEFLEHSGCTANYLQWCHGQRNMSDQFRAPFYNDIFGSTSKIRVYPMVPQDSGVTVTFFGNDIYGQPLRTDNGDGTWSDGVIVTAGTTYGETVQYIHHIDRVVKSASQGNIMIYGFDYGQNALYDLAIFEPSELNPSYLRTRLDGSTTGTCCGGCCSETVIALVKLKFIPVSDPKDGLIFLDGAEGALLAGIRAMKREDAGDFSGAKNFWGQAIEELQRQLEDFMPDATFSAQNLVFGDRTLANRCF